jgi:TonB family protein
MGRVAPRKPTPVNPVALRALPQGAWNQNRKVAGRDAHRADPLAGEKKRAESEKKREPEPVPKGRVVDVAPGNGEKPDDDAKFLAERDNRVKKETASRDATPFYKNAMPRPSTTLKPAESKGGHDTVDREIVAGNDGTGADEGEKRDGAKKAVLEVPSVEKRERLALKLDGLGGRYRNQEESDEVRGNSNRLRVEPGTTPDGSEGTTSSGRAGSRDLRTLTPSTAVLERLSGAPAPDLTPMDDVEEGSGTFLNTKEWKYSTFFNRIKQGVGQHWDPNAVVRRRDPTGEMFLYKDRYTVVSVTLDQRGLLRDVFVDKSCGVDFLDHEAIAAFHRAQPFPNPPPGLRNERGEIHFTFGFYLEVSSRPSLRLFRGAN